MKIISIVAALFIAAGCSKRDDIASKDSVLVTQLNEPPAPAPKTSKEGLVVDSFVTRQQPEMNTLKGMEPTRVTEIYDAYRPLRNDETTQADIDSFLRVQKITEQQLHAVLIEGDRLGWSGGKGR